MAQRLGGSLLFRVDGAQFAARGKFEYSPLTSEKEGIAGVDSVHGFTEKPRVPSIKGDLSDLGGISISNFQNLNGVVFTLELNNGKVIILTDGWVKGPISVNTDDGSYSVELEGLDIEEIVSA